MQKENNNTFINLLILPRFRALRHLSLIFFILFLSAGFMWFMQFDKEIAMTPVMMYGGLLLFMVIFLGSSYFNIYVLSPRFLLKNKWSVYFCSLMGMVLLIMVIIGAIQTFYEGDKPDENVNYYALIVSLLSFTLSIFLLFAGITTIVIFKNWILDMQRADELESATLNSELQMLKNQINPHFLFNMLNNANIMVDEDPEIASGILAKLEDMMRYQIDDSSKEKVSLNEDIVFITDYLDLEKIRRDNFEYTVTKEGDTDSVQIPPLLFITFVENAVKHNADSKLSYVHIKLKVENNKLLFVCENSKPLNPIKREAGGLGLVNIKRRLDLLYDGDYSLELNETETTYTVNLNLKL